MDPQLCLCSALKEQTESLKRENKSLLAEIGNLKNENENYRVLISQMRLLLGTLPPVNSESGSATLSRMEVGDADRGKSGLELANHRDDVSPPCEASGNVSSGEEDADGNEDEDLGNEANNPTSFEYSAGDDQGLDGFNGRREGAWKCAKCQKNIRGCRINRLLHIAAHKMWKLTCPFEGCDALLSLHGLKYSHIQLCHKIKCEDLSTAQKERIRRERAKLFTKSKEFEQEFFPEKNISEVFRLGACKKCGTKVSSVQGQKAHVASHLQLKIACPVPGCDKQCSFDAMNAHLRKDHALLSQETQERWNESREVSIKAIAEVIREYF